jgi:hypothetical protein
MNTIKKFLGSNNINHNVINIQVPGYVQYNYNQPRIVINGDDPITIDASSITNIIFKYCAKYNSESGLIEGSFVLYLMKHHAVTYTHVLDLSLGFTIEFFDAGPTNIDPPILGLIYSGYTMMTIAYNFLADVNTGGLDLKIFADDFSLNPDQWISRTIDYRVSNGMINMDYNDHNVFIQNEYIEIADAPNDIPNFNGPATDPIKITSKYIYLPTEFYTDPLPLEPNYDSNSNLIFLSFVKDKPINWITTNTDYVLKPIQFMSCELENPNAIRITRDRTNAEYAINQESNLDTAYSIVLAVYMILENPSDTRIAADESIAPDPIKKFATMVNTFDKTQLIKQLSNQTISVGDFITVNSLSALSSVLSQYT